MTSSAYHNDPTDEVTLNSVTSSALNLIDQAYDYDERYDYERGVLAGLVTGGVHLLSAQRDLSEEETVALFDLIIKRLAQYDTLRPLLRWCYHD